MRLDEKLGLEFESWAELSFGRCRDSGQERGIPVRSAALKPLVKWLLHFCTANTTVC